MSKKKIHVLLIESDIIDASLINKLLSGESEIDFTLDLEENLAAGLENLGKNSYDVIFLSISMPEIQGLDTLTLYHTKAPETPIIVMTRENSEAQGLKYIQGGAQDYIVKEALTGSLLVKSITYAVERSRLHMQQIAKANIDELTQLYSRRGFLSLAGQQQKIASRTNKYTLLFFIDIDGLKHINGSFGHSEGDSAIIETAKILRKTFREADIVSRIGGDEFAVLAVDTNEASSDMIINRIQDNIREFNSRPGCLFHLSLSIGVTHLPPQSDTPMEELLKKADFSLYEHKKQK